MDPQQPTNNQPVDNNVPANDGGLGDQPQVVEPTQPAEGSDQPVEESTAPAPEEPAAPAAGEDQGLGGDDTQQPA
jgi:hypothetical protein